MVQHGVTRCLRRLDAKLLRTRLDDMQLRRQGMPAVNNETVLRSKTNVRPTMWSLRNTMNDGRRSLSRRGSTLPT